MHIIKMFTKNIKITYNCIPYFSKYINETLLFICYYHIQDNDYLKAILERI